MWIHIELPHFLLVTFIKYQFHAVNLDRFSELLRIDPNRSLVTVEPHSLVAAHTNSFTVGVLRLRSGCSSSSIFQLQQHINIEIDA